MIKLAVLVSLLTSLAFSVCAYDGVPVMKTAESYLHVREKKGKNDAPEIDKFLKYIGLGPGYPYCLAFAEYCVGAVYSPNPYPITGGTVRFMGLVRAHPLRYKVYTKDDFTMGRVKDAHGAIGIFFHDTRTGHAFLFDKSVDRVNFKTIEGNTVGVVGGSAAEQRGEGKTRKAQGVFRKVRNTRSAPGWTFQGVIVPR